MCEWETVRTFVFILPLDLPEHKIVKLIQSLNSYGREKR